MLKLHTTRAAARPFQLRSLDSTLERTAKRTATGVAPRTRPAGWTWHHELEPGVMRLVPRSQHTPGSPHWNALHPNGRGSWFIWGEQ
ncbi:HNH endonuclease [Sorangium sp. So ce385]|uniref:HNH endonuclease n=1 Tax=Sorangium sp. So ce385 TaxID=3133308 RepID=UPI003F5C877E